MTRAAGQNRPAGAAPTSSSSTSAVDEPPTPPVIHEPTDEAFACFRLEVFRPYLDTDTKTKRAWDLLRETQRSINQAAQRAIRDVIVHIGNLRMQGKTRFGVPAEKANFNNLGIPMPPECYSDDDLQHISLLVNEAFKSSGVSEYVYASVARRLLTSELANNRLKDLLRGDRTYPDVRSVGIMMRSRNWKITTEPRIANGKTYEDIVVEIGALKPKTGKMRIVCRSLHGPQLARARGLLTALQSLGTSTEAGGWSKGALTIRALRRPGRAEKWEILLPYSSPRTSAAGSTSSLAVHRSVVNMLTAVCSDGSVYHFPGREIVALKHQMYARRRPIQRDLSARPHRGRGAKRHFRALARLADKEARATQTHLWSAARWLQTLVENKRAAHVVIDNFRTFDPDQAGPPWEPFVRRFPWADLLAKTIDALTRRAGVTVEEKSSRYISQRCPDCGHVAPGNVIQMPVVRGADTVVGRFKCAECGFRADPDTVAALNLGRDLGFKPPAREKQTG